MSWAGVSIFALWTLMFWQVSPREFCSHPLWLVSDHSDMTDNWHDMTTGKTAQPTARRPCARLYTQDAKNNQFYKRKTVHSKNNIELMVLNFLADHVHNADMLPDRRPKHMARRILAVSISLSVLRLLAHRLHTHWENDTLLHESTPPPTTCACEHSPWWQKAVAK